MNDFTADDVLEALRRSYSPRDGWVTAAEVCVGTGNGAIEIDGSIYSAAQRIDLYALNAWRSAKFERVAFEVKVSRSDLLAELRDSDKRAAAMALSNRFYFAVAPGVVDDREIPDDCGLIQVDGRGCVTVRKAPWRDTPEPPIQFVASLLRVAAEQRSIERRCAVSGCMGSARWAPTLSVSRPWRSLKFAMCQPHRDRWHEILEARAERLEERLTEQLERERAS